MTRTLALIVAAGILLAAGCGKKEPARPDEGPDAGEPSSTRAELEKLQGVWYVTMLEQGGEEVTAARGQQLVFEGEQFTLKEPDGSPLASGVCKLDLEAVPRTMDLAFRSGPHTGQTAPSIYALEEGRLRIRQASPQGMRPTQFAADVHPGHSQLVLTRKKVEPIRADPMLLEMGKLRDSTWIVVGVEKEGRRIAEGKGRQLIFLGDQFNLREPDGKVLAHGAWKLEAPGQNRTLDLIHSDELHQGKTSSAIYVFEREGLRISLAPPGGDRPKDFVTRAGSDVSVLTLKRDQAVKDEAEMEKLQGTWYVQTHEAKGKPVEEDRGHTFIFFEDQLNIRDGRGNVLAFGTCKPLRDGVPARMDLYYKGGPYATRIGYLIYELGADTLKICLAPPGAERPGEFATRPDLEAALFVLTRKKP